ncbi:M35 family metallo-endopeptidase [Pseudoduganella plicata]|uniref:Peptidase M35 n=1 Tax=Pseudoduganella plicata TaxID=321984 RepID=A0A4P7BD75_9BURK|nr:M35 family metallo-endopeptidase [Pseudoduganella plicata]QBQ35219.1 peptidase M35 [Pseudoduganella plicata]GGZ04966.1 peptidase M35 [Pseudoduganella plicata]
MSWNHMVRFGGTVAATALCMSAYAASGVVANISVDKQSLGPADDLVVKVTLTNTTSTPQRLLKWQTPFGPITESLFDVTRDGVPVAYEGKHVKRPAPRASDYFVIQPGKSHTASVELSSLYDLSATGDYAIRFVAIGPESAPTTKGGSAAKSAPAGEDDDLVKSEAVQVWIEGSNLRKSAPAPEGEGLTFTSCSASQQSSINSAFTAAKTMANGSVSYLNAGTRGTRYTKWFGTYDATRYNTVKTHFANIKNALDTKPVNVDCSCTDSYYAYVYPNQPYKIYVCNAFWSAPTSGTDSKGGTLVHELSHFTVVAGTDDWAYGQSAAASLATSNPARAVDNADSHEYFSENTPALP